jgi:glycosyltransferase involved in cell wall biosynthesis
MKLSVMMITYNHERFIAQALESVLAQRVNFDYEIVVGEDCSTDRTREILMDFCRRYPNRIVPLLRDKNIGAAQNAEGTLAACRGQYLALLEGDDYWTSPEKLQQQVNFLDTHPGSAMCCHRVQFLHGTGLAEGEVFPLLPAGAYTIEDLLGGNFVMTCSAVLRRDLVPSLPSWFRKMKLGDWPMFALAARGGTIDLMDDVMAVYRVHAESTWSSLPTITRLAEGSRMLKALDEHLDFRYTRTIRRTIAQSYFVMACLARQDGARTEAGKHLLNCIRNGGWRLPGSKKGLAGLAAYTLIGSWYKIFLRGKQNTTSPVT